LYIAAKQGDQAAVWGLVAAGAEVDKANTSGETPLHAAAEMGHEAAARALVASGAAVDSVTRSGHGGWTPLHAAAGWLGLADIIHHVIDRVTRYGGSISRMTMNPVILSL
jgi:hypothetical protein